MLGIRTKCQKTYTVQDSSKQEMTKFHRIRAKDVISRVITGAIFAIKSKIKHIVFLINLMA